MKDRLAKIIAKPIHKLTEKWSLQPEKAQERVFQSLIKQAKNTAFGADYHFKDIQTYEDFKQAVPVQDYEGLKPYIERIKQGEKNVLWHGSPLYFAKTSGTTSGTKYIPITKSSMPYHIAAARNALLNYVQETGRAKFFNGKMIFLQGSPKVEYINEIGVGRLSGIVANHVPKYLQKNRLPSYETNCIEDWEQKLDAIIAETKEQNMSLISGIPPWLQMYFEKLITKKGKSISEIFPNFNLMVTGGVNYEPYREKIQNLIGRKIDVIQTYPASEGFIAYQNSQENENLLMLLKHGIFYEFIPADEFFNEQPTRVSIHHVELNKDYVLIMNTNAGLWGYNIGDTIRFVEKNPYKIIVSGRIKHYTSAFGEHVIAHEVETALKLTLQKYPCEISEFTVAPQVNPVEGLPYHEWLIEFDNLPADFNAFRAMLDLELCKLNIYYDDLIKGNVLAPLKVRKVAKNGFQNYMKSQGKLGGQNKVPRLKNDREIADQLELSN